MKIHTDDGYHYQKVIQGEANLQKVNFAVEATNDITISLSRDDPQTKDSFEIVLGGWGGTGSAIRTELQGPNIVSFGHSKEAFNQWRTNFQLRVTEDSIGLYDAQGDTIIELGDLDTSDIKYVYIATGWGSTGDWTINPNNCITSTTTGQTGLNTATIYTQQKPLAYCRAYAVAFDWCPHRAHVCYPNHVLYDPATMATDDGKVGGDETEKMLVYKQLYLIKRNGSKVFDDAVSYCNSLGMRLPTPLDQWTNFQLGALNYGTFWLGVKNDTTTGNWIDIYTGEQIKWSYFGAVHEEEESGDESGDGSGDGSGDDGGDNFPGGDHAVHISTNGGMWHSASKDTPYNTICIHGKTRHYSYKL